MTLTLQDPQSGSLVHLRVAELPQQCRLCGTEVQGQWIVSVEDTGRGWVHLEHAERLLMVLPMSQEFVDRAKAKEQLRDAVPGDTVVVSRPMLSALIRRTR